MYGSRIPSLTLSNALVDAMKTNRDGYSRLQIQISTGQKYLARSDDPIETNEAASLENITAQINQWRKNVNTCIDWEKASDSVLQSILETMQRANEVVVEANDGTNAANRTTIAEEIDAVIESLANDANSKYTGSYLFSGVGGTNMTGIDPFAITRDASGKITSVDYQGSTDRRIVQISDTGSTQYGIVGEGTASGTPDEDIGIFKFENYENVAAEGDPQDWQNVEVNIFDTLIDLRDSLKDSDFTDWEKKLNRVQAGLDHVITKVIDNATSQQKFEQIENNLDALESSQVSRLSDLEDLDMAVAFNNLTMMQTNLQASLQMITRMNALSIVNFI